MCVLVAFSPEGLLMLGKTSNVDLGDGIGKRGLFQGFRDSGFQGFRVKGCRGLTPLNSWLR